MLQQLEQKSHELYQRQLSELVHPVKATSNQAFLYLNALIAYGAHAHEVGIQKKLEQAL